MTKAEPTVEKSDPVRDLTTGGLGFEPHENALPRIERDAEKTSRGVVIGDPIGAPDHTTRDANGLPNTVTLTRFSENLPGPAAKAGKAVAPNGPVAKGGEGEPAGSGEQYPKYVENDFRSPKAAPLSTFSADVNTASYSNARRFLLDQRQLPPKDAVFLAEFVNYFPYAYAKPKGDDPVALDLGIGPCPWNPKHHLVRVGVQARQLDPAAMPPRNLVFLVDTSGSMDAPNRLPLVVRSLNLLIDGLTPQDTVSLVTYAGTAGVALPPTRGGEKEAIRAAVNGLTSGGSTNGAGGITVAYDLAVRSFVPNGVNRVILCTDGDFNVGVSNHGDLVRMVEERRRTGVFLTVLGFGMGNYKDAMLKDLANHGNGHHAYIDSLEEARKVFVEQGGALVVVAKDVKFQVEFNPARVGAYRLLGYENRLLRDEDFKNDTVDAGEMGSGHQVTVLYEVVPAGVPVNVPGVDPLRYQAPPGPAAASDEWLTVKMRYKAPDGDVSKEFARPLAGDAFRADQSADFRWAASVAAFAQLLRDSPHKGLSSYAGVLEEATAVVGEDPNGHRRGFLELVRRAREANTPPRPAAPPRDTP
ncbi:MAG TPA: VWA domain-containing protein [Urbifossiella sp.]|nr:VWA domain-containing protein [Urbifossiella sp.]